MSVEYPTSVGRVAARVVVCCLLTLLVATTIADDDAAPTGAAPASDPDCRTLEDIYGDTGDFFQGGLGILNFESDTSNASDTGFGLSVDDHVIEWREFRLVNDAIDCAAGGSCAVVDLSTLISYEGNTLVTVSAFDDTFPWGNPPGVNNCDNGFLCTGTSTSCKVDEDCGVCSVGGTFSCAADEECEVINGGPGGTCDIPGGVTCDADLTGDTDRDCDGDGTDDIVVVATSPQESDGEVVYLNEQTPGEFQGDLAVSATYDVDGVLFVQRVGTTNPVITVTYDDLDDGTGVVCQNTIDPDAVGLVQAFTTVALVPGNVTVVGVVLNDSNNPPTTEGDGDGFADTGEVVQMAIRISNKTGVDLTGVTARLASNDENIDCITDSLVNIGDVKEEEVVTSGESFTFKINDTTDRATNTPPLTALDSLSAELSIILFANEFAGTLAPQDVTIDLDLNATSAGADPSDFFEGFEVASGFNLFTTMNLDEGQAQPATAFIASDGYRCQYSDPDYINSNSYQAIDDCFVAASSAQADRFHFQVHQTDDIDGGRAYEGTRSMYFGIFSTSAPDEHTTPPSVLEALRTNNPINLGLGVCSNDAMIACSVPADCPAAAPCTGVSSELVIKHQVSLMDWRTVNAPFMESADRGVVSLQLADGSGAPVGDWIKLTPYQNVYDQQGTDIYTNCMFDPIDDGNDEDDFFDPSDPNRRLGPSSTCFPEFSFTWIGDTFASNNFAEANIGNASDGPGLPGELGAGTWIESRFSLERFRGRRVRVRFLETALKLGTTTNWEAAFQNNPDPGDDGWWVDNVEVDNTLLTPAALGLDNAAPPLSTVCDTLCIAPGGGAGEIQAQLVVDPAGPLRAPGQKVELDASSSDGSCVDGTLQYRFWAGGIGGTLLRGWTDNAKIKQAPTASIDYFVEVRCSSDPALCLDASGATTPVDCPTSDPGGACPSDFCGEITAALSASPTGLPAPGPVTLDASGSTIDVCLGGSLSYRFWIDGDGDGAGGNPADTLLAGFGPASSIIDSPTETTGYVVDVRCSTGSGCFESADVTVGIGDIVFQTISAPDKNSFVWSNASDFEFVRGRLRKVRVYDVLGGGEGLGASIDISGDSPTSGEGFYYLVKEPGTTEGQSNTWSSGGSGEAFDRDALLPEAGCSRATPEAWVLSANQLVSVVDSCTEQELTTIDLTPLGGGQSTRSLAFSTVNDREGAFAFVTQGDLLRVIDVPLRSVIHTIDVSALAALPSVCSGNGNICTGSGECPMLQTCGAVTGLTLKGADTARQQIFDVGGPSSNEAILYVSADVQVTPLFTRPWFLVFDQRALTDVPLSNPALLQAASLGMPDGSLALDVTSISVPGSAGQFQRAWFTGRISLTSPEQILSVLVATPKSILPPSWSVQGPPQVSPLTGAQTVPDPLAPGSGFGGELSVLPEGPAGTLQDLDLGSNLCNFGGGDLGAVSVSGPGSGSYRLYAVDRTGNRTLRVEEEDIDLGTCAGATVFSTGTTPVAVDVAGQQFSERAFVANNVSDSVTVLRDDATQATINLTISDPVDIEFQVTTDSACNVENVVVNGNTVTWDTAGCDDEDQIFFIWCQCQETNPANCPLECPPTPGGGGGGEPCPDCELVGSDPWEPTGISARKGGLRASGLSYTDPFAFGADVTYTVTINEREPLPLLP